MRSLGIVVLSALLILGVAGAAVAQQTQSPPSAAPEQTKPGDDKAGAPPASPSASEAPKADQPAGSSATSSTTVEVKPEPRVESPAGGEGMASPRTETQGTRIFGLDPTMAALLAAGILVIVIIALVAMARGGSATHVDRVDHTDRRL